MPTEVREVREGLFVVDETEDSVKLVSTVPISSANTESFLDEVRNLFGDDVSTTINLVDGEDGLEVFLAQRALNTEPEVAEATHVRFDGRSPSRQPRRCVLDRECFGFIRLKGASAERCVG